MISEIWCEADVRVANGAAARAMECAIDREVEVVGEPGFGCRQLPKGRLASWLADLPALIWIVLRDLSGDARRGRA